MKSKKSRIGRKFQAEIPDLLTAKEREEERLMLFGDRSTPTEPAKSTLEPVKPDTGGVRLHLLRRTKQSDNDSARLHEQFIPNANLPNTNIKLSKEQYKRIVSVPRERYHAALEAQRRKFCSRRTSRRRGMRCQNYKEWDERGFSDDQSEEAAAAANSPKPMVKETAPRELQQDNKRTRTKDIDPRETKKRHLSNQNLPDVIDLVDLSDSPEATLCLIQNSNLPVTISSPWRNGRKYITLSPPSHSTVLGEDNDLAFGKGHLKSDCLEKKSSDSPAVPPNVLTNRGANTLPTQNRPQRIIGRLSGFRPSSSNSKAMIPVIEL